MPINHIFSPNFKNLFFHLFLKTHCDQSNSWVKPFNPFCLKHMLRVRDDSIMNQVVGSEYILADLQQNFSLLAKNSDFTIILALIVSIGWRMNL